ncbi:hypothetical protein KR054_005331 [Drosophila jambulina]|nr:hypothetical protein KR054_005331 [Drosophila jambulina]
MATMVRQFTRSVVRQLRQPRWNRLLLKSNINLHLLAIYQQRRFSQSPDDNEEQEKKFCIDYKKNPTVEGHEPPDLPDLKPVCPKLRITRRREFMQKKKCQEMEKEEKAKQEAEKCNEEPVSFSRVGLLWELPKFLDPDLAFLNQERTFCKMVEQVCLSNESSPSKPVPPKSVRMARKRRHFQAKKKKEAEAKAKALEKLKQACNVNTQAKENLKITYCNCNLIKEKDEGTPKVEATEKLKNVCNLNSETKQDLKIAQGNIDFAEEKTKDFAKPQDELNNLLQVIKDRCRKKREEFEQSREAESKKQAEETALRNKNKMAQIKKLCAEARKRQALNLEKLKILTERAKLRMQSEKVKLQNQSEEAKLRNQSENIKDIILNSKKEHSEDD